MVDSQMNQATRRLGPIRCIHGGGVWGMHGSHISELRLGPFPVEGSCMYSMLTAATRNRNRTRNCNCNHNHNRNRSCTRASKRSISVAVAVAVAVSVVSVAMTERVTSSIAASQTLIGTGGDYTGDVFTIGGVLGLGESPRVGLRLA